MISVSPEVPAPSFTTRYRWAAYSLGFSIGGFFDGILLHQVLQWHHLLSGIQSSGFQDIRIQILADGLFHVFMYVVGAVGLVLLWQARRELSLPQADRLLIGNGLIGFGIWHILDGIFSHWALGIHRIKMDSDYMLFWDLAWFLVFGVAFVTAGWLVRPKSGPGASTARRGPVAASIIALMVLVAAPVSALPPRDITGALIFFRPGMSPQEIMSAIDTVGGTMIWTDASGDLWAVNFDHPAKARLLYGRGAMLVSNSLFPAGCLAWSRAI